MGSAWEVGIGILFATTLWAGTSLLRRARRTGELPELLLGVALLGLGPLGHGLRLGAACVEAQHPILGGTLRGAGAVGVFIGSGAHYFFVVQVFRPRARWAWTLALLASALLGASFAGDMLERGLVNARPPGAWFALGMGLRMLAMAWGGGEALVWWWRLRQRVRVGVADPAAPDRFLYWALGQGTPVLALALAALARVLPLARPAALPVVPALCAVGVAATACMWLGFRRPGADTAWLGGPGAARTVPSAAERRS